MAILPLVTKRDAFEREVKEPSLNLLISCSSGKWLLLTCFFNLSNHSFVWKCRNTI